MPKLARFQQGCTSVFNLNGYSEDSATYALGWTLMKSPVLLRGFIHSWRNDLSVDMDLVQIELQKGGNDRGFTDIEIQQRGHFHIIIEAKKNWTLPSESQLLKYLARFDEDPDRYPPNSKLLVTMSAASEEYADREQASKLANYPIQHFSWKSILDLIDKSYRQSKSHTEKLWLHELNTHIKRYDRMTSPTDNLAYCVVLSDSPIRDDNSYSFYDVVVKDRSYFHPLGMSGWPEDAPNYLAFRYKGELVSVHHVDSSQVTNDLVGINKYWPLNESSTNYIVYKLGPPMVPQEPLKNGRLYATARIWCSLDTLLSGAYETIADARDETKSRIEG